MKYEEKKLSELVDTISDTRKIDKDKVVLVNTSDVLAGEVLNHTYTENCNLRGQFKKRFKTDDILYSEIRPANKRFAYIDFDSEDYIASTKLMVLRRKSDKITNKYLYYCLTNDLFVDRMQHLAEARSGTFPQITFDVLKGETIYLPSIANQNKITSILDNINNKIRLNNEINNNLYEMCNIIYHQLLDDNESNIEYKTIGEIAKKVITGKTPSTKNKEYWGGNIPFITIPDMHNQVFTINTERYITKEGAKSLVPKNSISVSCIATVGLVSINDKDSQTNQQINSIVIENDYDLYYLFEFLTEQEQYMKSIAGGSTTYNINKNTFENIQVPYLNKELIIEYDKKVRPMFEKIKSNQISNDTLSQLRDILLPKLMNGEIDLDNIEI